jgi:non-ribosomal peptide synthetase component E (peptide arylation enzyme)
MSNLALNLGATARRIPERTAVIAADHAMSYAELDAATSRLATFLNREGVGAGDRVG